MFPERSCRKPSLELPLNHTLNSLNSVPIIFVITVKGVEPATTCVRHQDATTCEELDL